MGGGGSKSKENTAPSEPVPTNDDQAEDDDQAAYDEEGVGPMQEGITPRSINQGSVKSEPVQHDGLTDEAVDAILGDEPKKRLQPPPPSARPSTGGSSVIGEPFEDAMLVLAEQIGIDLENEPELVWVAQECHSTPIKPPWARFADPASQMIYFWNRNTRETTWEHPYKLEFKRKVKMERAVVTQQKVAAQLTEQGVEGLARVKTPTKAKASAEEPTFISNPDRLPVLLASLTPMITQLEKTPPSWELEIVALHGTYKYGRRTIPWYHAGLRSCQVPYPSALFKIIKYTADSDPRLVGIASLIARANGTQEEEPFPELSPFNGRTVVSLDLSINDISTLTSWSLKAFLHLRKLDLSYNSVANLGGIAAADGLRELNLSMNRLSTAASLLGDGADAMSSPTGIQHLTKLRSLDLSHNRVDSLNPLSTLTNLRILNLNDCAFENLDGIERFASLEALHVKENALTTLISLATVPKETDGSVVPSEGVGVWKSSEGGTPMEGSESGMGSQGGSMSTLRIAMKAGGEEDKLAATLTLCDLTSNKLADLPLVMHQLSAAADDMHTLMLNDNNFEDAVLNRWRLLDFFPALIMLDGQGVTTKMRDYLGNLQRRKTVREIVTKARKEYTEQIEQQKRRKDWSIRALKRQGERVDEMFGQLKVKLQAELQMTEAEVSAILGEEGAYITEEDVTLSRDHAEFRLEDEEVQLQKFDKKLPRLREAAPEEQDAPEEKDSS